MIEERTSNFFCIQIVTCIVTLGVDIVGTVLEVTVGSCPVFILRRIRKCLCYEGVQSWVGMVGRQFDSR